MTSAFIGGSNNPLQYADIYQDSRKKACSACRHKKKRCDVLRPSCSACIKSNSECVYTHSANTSRTFDSSFSFNLPTPNDVAEPVTTAISNIPSTASLNLWDTESFLSPTKLNGVSLPLEPQSVRAALLGGYEIVNHPNFTSPPVESLSGGSQLFDVIEFLPTVNSDPPTTSTATSLLPPQSQLLELTHIFFQQYHPLLPCIHAQSVLDKISDPQWAESSPLLWSILATAATSSSAVEIRAQQNMWFERAGVLYERSVLSNGNVLRNVQAAVWNVYLQFIEGDILQASLRLSQAYTLACMHGFNRIDDDRKPAHLKIPLANTVEEEECRWTMWALLLLDRHINYLHGVYFVVNDHMFYVNYPCNNLADPVSVEIADVELFSRDLEFWSLTLSPGKSSDMQTICLFQKAVVLLGRIVEYENIVPIDADQKQRAAEYLKLQSILVQFWITVSTNLNNSLQEVRVTWLNIILHTCSILLNYPVSVCGKTDGLPSKFGPGSANHPGFLRAFHGVQAIVDLLKQLLTANQSLSMLLNPLLAPSYFLCCRFLVARWRQTHHESHRIQWELVVGLLDRMVDKGLPIARLYKETVARDVQNEGPTGPWVHLGLGDGRAE